MGIHTASHQHTFQPTSSYVTDDPVWNPVTILEILNPEKNNAFTCVGYAPSKRRRCQNRIAQHNVASVYTIFDKISLQDPIKAVHDEQLHKAAGLALCRAVHQDQVDDVVEKWQRTIKTIKPGQTRRTDEAETHGDVVPPASFATFDRLSQKMNDMFAQLLEQIEQLKKQQEYTRQQERQPQARERQRQEQQESERRRTEREDKARQDKEREEQRRREQEQQEQERQEREREKRKQEMREREARERAARNERVRDRAQRMCEEREREAREKAARERKEWDDAWDRYTTQWAALKESRAERSRDIVPWPVKSGHWKDITEANIKEFFRKAPPRTDTLRVAFKRMQAEGLKWHPDKIWILFGSTAPSETDRGLVNIISQIVILLRAEARSRLDQ